MTLVYRPDDPRANENGMVERNLSRRVAGAYVISDTIDGTWHPADGKHYDSKSNFRRVTKSRGMVEIGTERQADRRDTTPANVSRDVGTAIQKVRQGYRPNTEPGNYNGDGWQ
jgi:hypothetical protein